MGLGVDRLGIVVLAAGLAACGSSQRTISDTGHDGSASGSTDAPSERSDAGSDAPPLVGCPVGLSPGQVDQSDCPSDPSSFTCPATPVCVYPGNGDQLVWYCAGPNLQGGVSSCPGGCPAKVARLKGPVVPLDATNCLARPQMNCAPPRGSSEQDVVNRWFVSLGSVCPLLAENEVVVSFENGCATEMRLDIAPFNDFIDCFTAQLNAVRWTCLDLSCGSVIATTLP